MEVSFKQLYQASRQCRRGKAKGSQCQYYEANLLNHLIETQAALQSYQWQALPMHRFMATNGSKPREIHAPAYRDRVVQHWFVPQLQALIEPKFIYDCAANVKTKGTHFAVKRLQRMMRQSGTKAHYLQLDIHNFFYSINRRILLSLLTRHLHRSLRDNQISRQQARDFYWLCRALLQPTQVYGASIDRTFNTLAYHKHLHNTAPDCGLPIGNLSSQFFSNVYLNELDQFVKHELKCTHYIRYVDDFVLVHENPEQLQAWQNQIASFLQTQLQLRLKSEKILQPVEQGADFLGYIVRPHYCLVRRRVMGNWREKLIRWRCAIQDKQGVYCLTPENLNTLQSFCASYAGHLQHASYFTALHTLLTQYAWLANFFILSQGRLIVRWQNRNLSRFTSQCQWFVMQYPTMQVWLQKGRGFVNAKCPDKTYALSQLTPLLGLLRKQKKAYIWVAENGYVHHRLKHRQLSQLFTPGDLT